MWFYGNGNGEAVDLDLAFDKERKAINRRAREARASLIKLRESLDATGLHALIPHAYSTQIGTSGVYFRMNGDNVETRRLVHPFVAASGLTWKVEWGAAMRERSRWDRDKGAHRYWDECVRTCQIDAKDEERDIHYYINYGDGPIIQNGETLPSGCTIEIELEASVSSRAVSCKMR